MRVNIVAIGVLALFAQTASAELSEVYRGFMAGPAGFVATNAEKKSYQKLASDAEAEQFIELFWAKRDPNLATVVNEFKADFDARVAAADKQFGTEHVKGSMTDRGRTLIVMGRPFGISNHLADNTVLVIGDRASDERGGYEMWNYRGDKIPPNVKATEVNFIFVESRIGTKDFVLDPGERKNALALKLLNDAPERLLRNPDLKEVPRVGLLPGSKVATPAELAGLAAEPRPWPEGARVQTAQGVQSASVFPLWIHVHLPEAVPPATRLVGRVLSPEGKEAGSFSTVATVIRVAGGRAYELSLPLGPGAWKVELALLDSAAPVAVTAVTAQLDPVPIDGGWISPMVWGSDVKQESLASPGDPFNVGGWHVLPQPGDRYQRQDTLSYFCTVVRPGLSAAQTPAFQTTIAILLGTKKLTETDPQPAQLSQVKGDVWMFGSSLPLDAFQRPGEYRIEITVRDSTSTLKRTTSIPVIIAAQ